MNFQQPGQNNESFEVGAIVADTYKILDFIGQGGMGKVFKVEHLILAKVLAMKVLQQDQVSTEVWQRFRTEAQAIARVDHLNIIKIYDMSQTAGGLPFYTMDYLQGESLADRLDENGRLSVEDALPIFEQICNGLGYAHDRGIIHRDIKPGNIMILSGTGQVKLVDFGIAKLLSYDTNVHQGLTKPGEVFGSPLYMSPEQSLGQKVDYRTDMYSVGVTMFQALTGKPPLLGKSAIETIALHQTASPPSMSEVAVNTLFPPALEAIVANLMSKAPEQRPTSLYDVAEQLKILKAGKEISPRESAKTKIAELSSSIEETQNIDTNKRKRLLMVAIPIAVILTAALAYTVLKTAFTNTGVPHDNLKVSGLHEFKPTQYAQASDDLFEKSIAPKVQKLGKVESDLVKQFLAKNKEPYSHAVKIRGKDFLQFDFPEKFSLGKIWYQRTNQREIHKDAQGQIVVPKGTRLGFETGITTANYPELLTYFRPNELAVLAVRYLPESHPRIGDFVCKMRGLSQLDFKKERELQTVDLKWIDRVPDVERLNLSENPITAGAMAPLKMWSRVSVLDVDYKLQVTDLLKVLVAKQRITHLSIARSDLNDQDYELISRLKNLTFLNIRDNKTTDNQLAKLTKLKAPVVDINMHRCRGLTPKSLALLTKFKNLKILTVSDDMFAKDVLAALKKNRPDLEIRIPD